MRLRITVICLVTLFTIVGFTVTLNATQSVDAQDSVVEVQVLDSRFEPETITVTVGTTVRWVNEDTTLPHNVSADDGRFRSGDPSVGPWEYEYTFETAGTYLYHCEVHASAGMTGTVVVEELPPAAYLPIILKE